MCVRVHDMQLLLVTGEVHARTLSRSLDTPCFYVNQDGSYTVASDVTKIGKVRALAYD